MNIFSLRAKRLMKKFFIFSAVLIFPSIFLMGTGVVFSEEEQAKNIINLNEILLEDYGHFGENIQAALNKDDSSAALAAYVDMIVMVSWGIGSILAVGLIIWGGIEYVTAESFSGKSGGKDKLIRAFGGLLILFSAFFFFNTINPELLKVRFNPPVAGGEKTSGTQEGRVKLPCEKEMDEVNSNIRKYIESLSYDGYFPAPTYDLATCERALKEKKKDSNDTTAKCRGFVYSGDCGGRKINTYIFGWKNK